MCRQHLGSSVFLLTSRFSFVSYYSEIILIYPALYLIQSSRVGIQQYQTLCYFSLLLMPQNSQQSFLLCLSRVWDKCRLPLKYKCRPLPCLSFPNKLCLFYSNISVVWILSKFLLNPILYYALRLPVPPVLFFIALLLAHRLLIRSPDWAAICSSPSCDLTVNPSISFPLFPLQSLCSFFSLLSITSLGFDRA